MAATASIDFIAIAYALRGANVDAAINLGLLDWDGDIAALRDTGLNEADIAQLQHVRAERLTALAARARYRARDARLQRLQAERRQRQAKSVATDTRGAPALAGAAAAALARAMAKARR